MKKRAVYIFFLFIGFASMIKLPAMAQELPMPEDSTKEKNGRFIILPIITASPETSLRFGVASLYVFRPMKSSREETQLSTIRLPISYTINNQVKVRLSYDIFFPRNDHVIKGFVEWFRFPLLFWGIGTDAPDEAEEIYTTTSLSIEINYLKRVGKSLFVGPRFAYLDSEITEKEEGGLLEQEGLIPGNDGGRTSGLGVIGRWDKRDNRLNATRGPFLEAAVTTFQGAIGSDFAYTEAKLDFRQYWEVFGKHVLAFQAVYTQQWGEPGFETMALLGGDMIMRGHYLGRFRDRAMWATQVEYRLPLGRKTWIKEEKKIPFWQRWGLTGFAGVGNVGSNIVTQEWSEFKSSFGVGLRFLALPKERVNIRFDVGFGTQRPGFYFNVREAF